MSFHVLHIRVEHWRLWRVRREQERDHAPEVWMLLKHTDHFPDQHSHWNKKHKEYCYTYEEFRGPHMGGFGGWHCR